MESLVILSTFMTGKNTNMAPNKSPESITAKYIGRLCGIVDQIAKID